MRTSTATSGSVKEPPVDWSSSRNSLPGSKKSILKSQSHASESSIHENEGSAARKSKKDTRVSFCGEADMVMAAALAQLPEQSPPNGDKQSPDGDKEKGPDTYDTLDVDRPVPKKLAVTCVKHAEVVERINRRLLSGLQVGAEEWEELRTSIEAMSQYFNEGCRFAWEGQP